MELKYMFVFERLNASLTYTKNLYPILRCPRHSCRVVSYWNQHIKLQFCIYRKLETEGMSLGPIMYRHTRLTSRGGDSRYNSTGETCQLNHEILRYTDHFGIIILNLLKHFLLCYRNILEYDIFVQENLQIYG